jgi:hypothetical protein
MKRKSKSFNPAMKKMLPDISPTVSPVILRRKREKKTSGNKDTFIQGNDFNEIVPLTRKTLMIDSGMEEGRLMSIVPLTRKTLMIDSGMEEERLMSIVHPQLFQKLVENDMVDVFLRILDDGYVFTEDDPMLLIYPNGQPGSQAYIDGGNYGVTGVWPGGVIPVAGPLVVLPPGVGAAPPNAFGKYIAESFQQQGVVNLSGDRFCAFHIPNDTVMTAVANNLRAHPQFRRIGPVMAGLIGIPVELELADLFRVNAVNQIFHPVTYSNA